MGACALYWRHNGRDSVSNHQPHECLLNRSFSRRSKKTSKLRVTGLCVGNSPVTGEFPAQRTSNARNVSISWRLRLAWRSFCGLRLGHLSLWNHRNTFLDQVSVDEINWDLICRWLEVIWLVYGWQLIDPSNCREGPYLLAVISNHRLSKVCDEMTYPFLYFSDAKFGMDKYLNSTVYNGYNYLSMLGLHLIHVNKMDLRAAYLIWLLDQQTVHH